MPKKKKLALNSRIQNYQILTNDDEVCIPSLSSTTVAGTKSRAFATKSCQNCAGLLCRNIVSWALP